MSFRQGKAVLHRRNPLFHKTMNGAQAGDLFMGLIHICELNRRSSFGYLVALLLNPAAVAAYPAEWMPWACAGQALRPAPRP